MAEAILYLLVCRKERETAKVQGQDIPQGLAPRDPIPPVKGHLLKFLESSLITPPAKNRLVKTNTCGGILYPIYNKFLNSIPYE